MRKLFITSSLTLIALVLLLIACERKEATPATENKPISLVNGTLRFTSIDVLQETKKKLASKNQDELADWEKQFLGYTSMRKAFSQIGEEDVIKIAAKKSLTGYDAFASLLEDGEDQELVRNIDNDAVATFADKDGWLYVGKDGYRYTYDRIIKVENINDAKRSQYGAALESNSAVGVEVSFISRTTRKTNGTSRTVQNGRISIAYNNEDVCIADYWHGGSLCCKKRFIGEINGVGGDLDPANQDYEFYELTAASKHQRRTSGIWFQDATNELTVTTAAVYNPRYQPPVTFPSTTRTLTGTDIVKISVYASSLSVVSITSFTGTHSGICDDGRPRGCDTSWF